MSAGLDKMNEEHKKQSLRKQVNIDLEHSIEWLLDPGEKSMTLNKRPLNSTGHRDEIK